jgi:hypothetical protein
MEDAAAHIAPEAHRSLGAEVHRVAAHTTCTSVMSNIRAPVDQMYPVSPCATPCR